MTSNMLMVSRRLVVIVCGLSVGLGMASLAQASDDDDMEAALGATNANTPVAAAASASAGGASAPTPAPASAPASSSSVDLPQIGAEDQLAVFQLERGRYFATNMGVFLSLSGTKSVSDAQPFVALKAGQDIGDHFGIQLSVAAGYSAGNPANANNDPEVVGAKATVNYELINMGVELVGAYRPTQRFAIEPKIGGGITRMSPQVASSDDLNKKLGPYLPHLVAGVDFSYLTLLTDFTAGITVDGYYIVGADLMGIGTGLAVRYTF